MKRGFLGSSHKKPADSRTICKSTREESIDTLQAASIDSVNQASNNTIQLVSDHIVHYGTVYPSTVHLGTVHLGTVQLDTFHPASIDTVHLSSIKTVHLPSIDTVHVPSIDTVHLSSIDTVHLPSIDTVHPALIDIVHPDTVHPNTVLPNTLHPDTFYPGSVHPDTVDPVKNNTTCGETEKIEVLILKIKREDQILIQLLRYIMVEGDKQHVSGELSRVEEADFSDTTSALIDTSTAASINDLNVLTRVCWRLPIP
ncbi:hypothetical protein DY000_02006831 [Brassica cretica]|uniref:Uncharacterized protein n=1 Tax=Brassica cretica TaxID=69181 RepID=A0ABQ7BWQ5_BRACR|nr:hypothetical protein DY000_02006831 [Brassica cretica]